jgi:O-methyltransferase
MNRELIFNKVKPITLLEKERVFANIDSVQHIIDHDIDGDIVEVGVFKGGSIISMILALEELKIKNRKIHLFDTFEGMTEPTNVDIDLNNQHASILMDDPLVSCGCSLNEVIKNVNFHCKYPKDLINYHKGDILKTIFIPSKIAILRLDTDWYESTKFELENFYDKVSKNGVIIIDDYGHWQGCKKAVDEFLSKNPKIEIEKIDYTGVKFFKI